MRAEQEHSDELTRALQEREDHVSTLEQQRQYAYDSVDRLQENIRQRDAEIAEHLKRIKERDNELDEVREGLTRQRREHNRIVDEQSRRISEVVAREVEARANYEHLVKVHAEADVQVVTLTERVGTLTEEIEKLRKRVHDLQQQSAADEMKHAHYAKQRAQDKEDLKQANIAIDSKQTEIEMVRYLHTRTRDLLLTFFSAQERFGTSYKSCHNGNASLCIEAFYSPRIIYFRYTKTSLCDL